jgi:glycosidase
VLEPFYTTLMQLKKTNGLIASGDSGGVFTKVATDKDKQVYCFLREKGGRKMFVLLNFSEADQKISLRGDAFAGDYKELFTGEKKSWKANEKAVLGPWQYQVYVTE